MIHDLPSLPSDRLRELPSISAVYFVVDGDRIVYIGRSKNLHNRWNIDHQRRHMLVSGVHTIHWLAMPESELKSLEMELIRQYKPEWNGTSCPAYTKRGNSPYKPITGAIQFRLEPSKMQLVKLAADQENITPSEWIRRAAQEKLQRLQRSKKGSKNGTRD